LLDPLMKARRFFSSWLLPCIAVTMAGVIVPSRAKGQAADEPYDWQQWRQFWAFQPVRKHSPPSVNDEKWARNPIDRFILAELEKQGLKPAPEVDKGTLIRRATFDLLGLPPTPQEIRAFAADKSADAYERLIDRLLDNPHYGERWGRHWLDVARYVQGRITFPGIKNTSGDQAYRDYVVRAFNKDKPYDQFITEQIAGDLLPPTSDREQYFDQITAPAFLSIGAWFDQCTDPNRLRLEMVDDQINVTTQAFLGLSVACARCHDHKFDPIPTADYYALGGIFRSTKIVGEFSEFWRDGRVRSLRPLAMPDEVAANDQLLDAVSRLKERRWALLAEEHQKFMERERPREPKYRAAAARVAPAFVKLIEAEDFDGQYNLRIAQLMNDGNGVDVVETLTPGFQWAKYKVEALQTGQYRLDALYSSNEPTPISVTANGQKVAENALAEPTGGWELKFQRWQRIGDFELREGLNFLRLTVKAGNFPRLDRLRLYRVDDSFDKRVSEIAAAEKLQPLLLASFAVDPNHPWPKVAGMAALLDDARQHDVADLDKQIEQISAKLKPHPLIVSVTDQQAPADLPVHIRGGTYSESKSPSPRGVPRLLDHLLARPPIPANHSGRLELAKWLTDSRNPLPARVMVNRIWHWHFGRGIVASPSDFGGRGQPPTHPQLLDWLASSFVADGWSIKQMHRLMMTSSAYRMSSRADDESQRIDPENRLLSHFARRRLEAEAMYDAMLCSINNLPPQPPGNRLDVEKSKNRAMYVLAANRSPKGLGGEIRKMFPLFDYDASGLPIAARPASSTAAQSLFWLNSPLVKYYADKFAQRLLKMDKLTEEKRVEMAYLIALGHSPSKEMAEQALAYVRDRTAEGQSRQDAWAQLCQAIYGSAEFHYVD
jgi:hypothetical protein